MKSLLFAEWGRSLLAGAALALAGAFSAEAQSLNTNLQIAITAPANGASFNAPTNIQINALASGATNPVAAVVFLANPGGIGIVDALSLYLGTVFNGVPAGSNSELFALDWSNALPGTWAVAAQALDTNGDPLAGAPPVTITVTSAPFLSVDLASPTNEAVFVAPTTIQLIAGARDPGGSLAYVQFFDGANSLGIVSNGVVVDPPGSPGLPPGGGAYFFDWTNASIGEHALTVMAFDANGQSVISSPVIIKVEGGPILSVKLTWPTNGATFPAPGPILLAADATDQGGSQAYAEFFDGTNSIGVVSNAEIVYPLATTAGAPQPGPLLPVFPVPFPLPHLYDLTWTNPTVGSHILTVAIFDTNGLSLTSPPVAITISSNLPPLVRMTNPANNADFHTPINLALLAYAKSPTGCITNIQFFAGSNSLGFGEPFVPVAMPAVLVNPLPPYFQTNIFELIWSNAPVGSYALTVVAAGNGGISSTSTPVNITIEPPLPPPTNRPALVTILASEPVAVAGTNCWSWLGLTNSSAAWSNWASPVAVWRWFTNCGPEDATFTIRRVGPTNDQLTIGYSIGGTASNGVDYAGLTGVATIPAGQSEVLIPVVPSDDDTNGILKTVVLSLQLSTNFPPDYVFGFPRRAEAIIIDSDSPPLAWPGGLLEDRSFLVTGAGPDGAWFRMDYSTNGVAWVPICTNQVVNGVIDFADPDAPNSSMRLYRTVPLAKPQANK